MSKEAEKSEITESTDVQGMVAEWACSGLWHLWNSPGRAFCSAVRFILDLTTKPQYNVFKAATTGVGPAPIRLDDERALKPQNKITDLCASLANERVGDACRMKVAQAIRLPC